MKKTLLQLAALGAVCSAQAAIVVIDENLPEVTVDGNGYYYIGQDLTLSASNEYILASYTFVNNGATLTIPAGTILRGEPGAGEGGNVGSIGDAGNEPGTLIVTRDGQIDADGTSGSPIIFTTAVIDENGDNIPDSVDFSGAYDYAGNSIVTADFLDNDPVGAPLPPFQEAAVIDITFGIETDGTGDIAGQGSEHQGYWGGIIILGNAPTSIGDIDTANDLIIDGDKGNFPSVINPMEGQIEGLNTQLVGVNSVYGGRNPNDSSGTLRYVAIRHGGYKIANANEINGLTLGGVGFGTTIEYIEVYSNQDDAYEWFGGTVNSRYLVALYNNDDSFDMDEGFTGLGQFWFSFMNDDSDNGNAAGEHDGTDAEGRSVDQFAAVASAPTSNLLGTGDAGGGLVFTYPTVYNATYVGSGTYSLPNVAGNHKGNNIFTLRDSWGGAYFNSIFSDHGDEAIWLAVDGDERWDLGDIVFRSNVWYGNNAAYTSSTWSPSTDRTEKSAGDAHLGANQARALQVFNNTGDNFENNVQADPFAATNRIASADDANMNGDIKRRNWDADFNTAHGGFDPAEVTAAVTGLTLEPYTSTFFIDAGYAGAFNPLADNNSQALWTDAWTVFSALYYQDR